MRIAMVAMSGVRAQSAELNALGLTFPGVLERGRVIASMPTLSLLTLAGMCDRERHEISYHEIRDLRAVGAGEEPPPMDVDLVLIASQSAQIGDAYRVADTYRAAGVPVVMGGIHVSCRPEEALEHATSVVVGEGEPVWPTVLADAERGRLRERYDASEVGEFDLGDAPLPAYDLLDPSEYNRLLVQTSRGCPHRCEFCASSILLTKKYKTKPLERVIEEVRQITSMWGASGRPFIELADDNSFVDRGRARALLRAMIPERVKWFTEADISIADDPALLDLMREAGCRQVLVGLESPRAGGLAGLELKRDWKLRQLDRSEQAVRTIQAHGITVNGCFILGLDGDTPDVFDAVYDFIDRTFLFEAQLTVLTAFPGTPLHERLAREGRILKPGAWDRCTLFDVNIEPRGMTPDELQRGLLELAGRVYEPSFVESRRRRFFEHAAAHRRAMSANGIVA